MDQSSWADTGNNAAFCIGLPQISQINTDYFYENNLH